MKWKYVKDHVELQNWLYKLQTSRGPGEGGGEKLRLLVLNIAKRKE